MATCSTRKSLPREDKIIHNKVAKAAKTNHCRSLVETVLSSWPLCPPASLREALRAGPCCEISGGCGSASVCSQCLCGEICGCSQAAFLAICPLRNSWLASARAVRNLNAVDVCLDGSGLHCVIWFGQGLLELVWNDLILHKLLEIRRQFGL